MLCNKLSQIKQLKTAHICYYILSIGQGCGHGLNGSSDSGCLTGCHGDGSQGEVLSEGLTGEGSASKLMWLRVGCGSSQAAGSRASVPPVCGLEDALSALP